MKLYNKITAVALVVATLLISLISCAPEVESYKATVKTSFASNDAAMVDAIAAFEKSDVTLYVKGDDVMTQTSTKVDDVQMDRTFVAIGGMLYNTTTVLVSGKSANEKQKAPFGTAQRAEILAAIGAGVPLDKNDFNTVTESSIQSMTSYTCSNIKDDAKASLVSFFSAKLSSIGGTASLVDAEYYVETSKSKTQSYILNARFEITVNGNTYGINMTVECDYDYNAKVNISAPSGNYTEVTYKDIIG